MEGTLEPFHFHLVLSPCPIALVVAAKLLDMLITLGKGDKALIYLQSICTGADVGFEMGEGGSD